MTKKTHISVGIVTSLRIINHIPPYALFGVIGATLPDIDLILGIKHRTFTHSLLALFLSTMVVMVIDFNIGIVFSISYLSHLILDSFTKMGVPWFYPFSKKYYGLKIIKTGGAEDLLLCILAIYLILS